MNVLDNIPKLILVDPEREMGAAVAFCNTINSPLLVTFEGKQVVMLPCSYYLTHFCSCNPFEVN